jgi:two-component system sensor histidine kinase KdpD
MDERPHDAHREFDDLVAALTHEFSTPLTIIGGYAEMLTARLDGDATAQAAASAISRNARHLGERVADLADARSNAIVVNPTSVDFAEVLDDLRRELQPMLRDHEPTWQLPSRPTVVEVDGDALRRVVRHLVGNAAKFTPPGTPLTIAAELVGDDLVLRVADRGHGIADHHRDALFDPFGRLDSTRPGLGLGLHLSRAIARAHGGDVTYEPTHGRGATFVVRVPCRASTGEA